MTEVKHHRLGPSSAARWILCPGSANAEVGYDNPSNPKADEGSAAHELAELTLLSDEKRCDAFLGELVYTGEDDGVNYYVDDEMVHHVQAYVDYVIMLETQYSGELFVETRVQLDRIVPGGFGTSDANIIGGKTLVVVDLKYGKGILVDAFKNPQGLFYAVGAYDAHRWLYDIEDIEIHIHQPRIDNISEYKITTKELLDWADTANQAYLKTLPEDAPRIPGKVQCQFCLARADCKPRLASLFEDIVSDFADFADPVEAVAEGEIVNSDRLTLEELAKVHSRAKEVSKLLQETKEKLTNEARSGKPVPGFKLVRGRGSRDYLDYDKAFLAFGRKLGLDVAAPRKLVSAPQLEKLTDKKGEKVKGSRLFNAHVESRPGSLVLAPADDRRKEVVVDIDSDFDEF